MDVARVRGGERKRILDPFPGVLVVAVYPVPDPRTGDQVMAAIHLEPGASFDPVVFAEFCRTQPDMGTRWSPRFVLIVETMPVNATRKIAKPSLRRESWNEPSEVYVRGGVSRDDDEHWLLTDEDREPTLADCRVHGRRPQGA